MKCVLWTSENGLALPVEGDVDADDRRADEDEPEGVAAGDGNQWDAKNQRADGQAEPLLGGRPHITVLRLCGAHLGAQLLYQRLDEVLVVVGRTQLTARLERGLKLAVNVVALRRCHAQLSFLDRRRVIFSRTLA